VGFRLKPFEKGLVLCIDPGLRCCGVALYHPAGYLLRAGLPQSPIAASTGIRGVPAWNAMGLAVREWYFAKTALGSEGLRLTKVLIEEQRIDGRTPNPDDMLQVNGVAGACSVLFPDAGKPKGFWPETWKGSIPKADMTARIIARMEESPDERARIELEGIPKNLQHNIYDGIGIGLYHFVRLDARKVIHR
jgi:hypothetical protein